MLVSDGRDGMMLVSVPESEKVYVVPLLPVEECARVRLVLGVAAPSPRSDGPAHALKTASRIEGVNRDSVRCESVRTASLTRFF